MIEVTLPWPPKELSPNSRPHHMALARHKKKYKEACFWVAKQQGVQPMQAESLNVQMTFFRPAKHHYDADNLVAAMKSGLDGLALALGVDDRIFRLGPPVIADQIGGTVKVRIA